MRIRRVGGNFTAIFSACVQDKERGRCVCEGGWGGAGPPPYLSVKMVADSAVRRSSLISSSENDDILPIITGHCHAHCLYWSCRKHHRVKLDIPDSAHFRERIIIVQFDNINYRPLVIDVGFSLSEIVSSVILFTTEYTFI